MAEDAVVVVGLEVDKKEREEVSVESTFEKSPEGWEAKSRDL